MKKSYLKFALVTAIYWDLLVLHCQLVQHIAVCTKDIRIIPASLVYLQNIRIYKIKTRLYKIKTRIHTNINIISNQKLPLVSGYLPYTKSATDYRLLPPPQTSYKAVTIYLKAT